MKDKTQSDSTHALIWDLPTRIFHWLLLPTIITAWLTTDAIYFEIHLLVGYLLLFLLLFRLIWGFVGSHYARFRSFSYSWRAVREHLHHLRKGAAPTSSGHNPAAGWMVFVLLSVLLLIALSGLLTLGGEEQSGPLRGVVSIETGAKLHEIHNLLAWGLILLIPLHLTGVAVERWRSKRKLVRAMFTGGYHTGRPMPVGRRMALVSGLLLSTPAVALWLIQIEETPSPVYANTRLESHHAYPLWQSECGGCHTLHHPSLLPTRSWNQLMAQTEHHFEEDLVLDTETQQAITQLLAHYAAEQAQSEAAWKISSSIPANATPLQITTTPYWREKHDHFSSSIWQLPSVGSKVHCDGCHQDAETGHFQDRAVELPGV